MVLIASEGVWRRGRERGRIEGKKDQRQRFVEFVEVNIPNEVILQNTAQGRRNKNQTSPKHVK